MQQKSMQRFPTPQWRQVQAGGELPRVRSGHTSTCLDDTVLIFGGGGDSVYFNDTICFNTVDDQWYDLEVDGEPPCGRAYHSTVLIGSQLLIFGGWKGDQFLNDLYILDGSSGYRNDKYSWTVPKTIGQTPSPRAYHTSSAAGSKMLVFGGWFMDFCNDLMVLDTESFEWYVQPMSGPIPKARAAHSATLHNHRLFVFGGESKDGRLNDVWVLDTNTMHWSEAVCTGNPPSSRSGHTATMWGEWLVIFGGWDGDRHLKDTHMLNIDRMEWMHPEQIIPMGETPEARSGHTCCVFEERLYLMGGWDRTSFLNDTWVLEQPVSRFPSLSGTPRSLLTPSGETESTRLMDLIQQDGPQLLDSLPQWSNLLSLISQMTRTEPTLRARAPPPRLRKEAAEGGAQASAGTGLSETIVAKIKAQVVELAAVLANEVESKHDQDTGEDYYEPEWDANQAPAPLSDADYSTFAEVHEEGRKSHADNTAHAVPTTYEAGPNEAPDDPFSPTSPAAALTVRTRPAPPPAPAPSALGRPPRAQSSPTNRAAACVASSSKRGRRLSSRSESSLSPWVEVPQSPESLCTARSWAQFGRTHKVSHNWLAWYLGRAGRGTSARRLRRIFGSTGQLWDQLQRELKHFRQYREELNELASTVDVQPLFSAYAELLKMQETIRNNALSGAFQQAQTLVATRDETHNKCLQLSQQLHNKLDRIISKQQNRQQHLSRAVVQLKSSLSATEVVMQTVAASENPEARNRDACELPTFLMASDAVEALEEPMREFDQWRQAELAAGGVGEVLATTDAAMNAVNAAIEAEVYALDKATPDVSLGSAHVSALVAAAKGFMQHLRCEDVENSGEMEHTQSLLADCGAMANKLNLLDRQRREGVHLQAELAEVSRDLLTTQEEVIRMNAEVELQRLHNAGSRELEVAELALARRKEEAAIQSSRKHDINEQLTQMARENHPELLCISQGELSSRLCHTGLVVKRCLGDYEQVSMLHNSRRHVMLVKFNRRLCVLKEVTLHNEATRKVFENEVNLLWKLQHPAIVTVEAVFYDTLRAYIQMPYLAGGTLRAWVANNDPKPWEIQSVFRQLLQGLAYLHDHGIVHRDMKLDNVLMEEEGLKPIICDLGISKDRSSLLDPTTGDTATATSTILISPTSTNKSSEGRGSHTMRVKGTEGYIAPEVLQGEAATSAADMWAVGVMLHKTMFMSDPVFEGGSGASSGSDWGTPLIPKHENESLRQLLQALLQPDPEMRISANEALSFPYFTRSFVRGLYENKQILESDSKLDLLRQHVRNLQEGRTTVSMRVRRTNLLEDVVSIFAEMEGDTIYYPIQVRFIGEPGVDVGGLTSELYTDFFNRVLEAEDLSEAGAHLSHPAYLEQSESSSFFECPPSEDTPLSGVAYLPNQHNRDLHTYRMIGRVLVKSIIDRRPIPARFAPSFFKYLLGIKPSLRDLELYDRTLATTLQEVLVKPVATLGGIYFETPSGHNGEPVPVTDSNKHAYVQSRVHEVLVECRVDQLRAIREGFQEVNLMPYLQVFSCTDLMLLVCGEEHLDAHMVIELIEFSPEDWPTQSQTPDDLLELLRELRPNDLRRFLRLATSQCTITRGHRTPITIHRCPPSDRLPVGRTCFQRIDIPDYNDPEVLREKMLLALATMDGSGFGMS